MAVIGACACVRVSVLVSVNRYLTTFAGNYPCIPRHSGAETSCGATMGNHPVHLCWNDSSAPHHIASLQGI